MLSWSERLILWNQYEILKHIDPDQAKHYDISQEIVSSGYEGLYGDINPSIYEETVGADVSDEVISILNMFRAIKFSAKRLNYEPKGSAAEFEGFDANAGGGHYGVAHFLRRKQDKWQELQDRPDNSHSSSSLARYRSMLREWDRFGRRMELSEADIEQITDLGQHSAGR